MKIGFDPYLGTRDTIPAPELVDKLADIGYEGMNVVFTPDFLPVEDDALIEETRRRLCDRGLRVPTAFITHDRWLREPGRQDDVREWMATVVELARRFDAPRIGVSVRGHPKGLSLDEERALLRENLKTIVPMADAAGKCVAIEFETDGALTHYCEAIDFARAVDPRLRLIADTYHMFNHDRDFHATTLALRDLVAEVHISASDRGEPGSAADECDYTGLMQGLREIAYDGWLIVQYKLEDPASMERAHRCVMDLIRG